MGPIFSLNLYKLSYPILSVLPFEVVDPQMQQGLAICQLSHSAHMVDIVHLISHRSLRHSDNVATSNSIMISWNGALYKLIDWNPHVAVKREKILQPLTTSTTDLAMQEPPKTRQWKIGQGIVILLYI